MKKSILKRYGAEGSVLEILSKYNNRKFNTYVGKLPLEDEAFVSFWKDISKSEFAKLREFIFELNFPIKKGMSKDSEYLLATEQGLVTNKAKKSSGLALGKLQIELIQTPGGKIPVILLEERDDFDKIVQALSYSNEPSEVPKSMGAATYANYNNWGRVNRYKDEWLSLNPYATEMDWAHEFTKIVKKQSLYKDTFMILSNSPYSNVPHGEVNLSEKEWKDISLEIRKYHETSHYFMKRVLGSMENNVLDEILCDYVGLVKAIGSYNLDWALKFVGLENFPEYREGARLENYYKLPKKAEKILQALVYDAMNNIAKHSRKFKNPYEFLIYVSKYSLEDLAVWEE